MITRTGAIAGLLLFLGLLHPGAGHAQYRPAAPIAPGPVPGQGRAIGLITGGVDGTYVRIASDISAVLDDGPRMRIVPMLGKGSLQNVQDLIYLRGVDLAIVQSDVLAYLRTRNATPGVGRSISYVAKLYDEELHILAGPDIKRLQDLEGKLVNVDSRGSGTALTAATLFEGLKLAIQPVNYDQATALEKLRQGEIAALAYVAGKPARLFAGVQPPTGLHFVPVPITPELLNDYVPSKLDNADYPALVPAGQPVETVAVGAVMAAFAWPPGSEGHRRLLAFVDVFFDALPRFRQAPRHPKWQETSLDARVPGWTRFSGAEDWLRRRASAPPRN